MLRSTPAKIILILLFALGLGYFDLPSQFQIIPKTPEAIKKSNVNLGLDLQGGSQLDYKIDLRKVPEAELLERILVQVRERYPSFSTVLIDERNVFMAQRLAAVMKKEPGAVIVAVVGAGHQKAIVELLKTMVP